MAVRPASTERVPAWKRLGLQLKNSPVARNVPDQPLEQNSTDVGTPKKRKAMDIESVPQDLKPETIERPLKRKKSVAFADGTKADDGDSNEKLLEEYFAQQSGGEADFSQSEVAQFSTPSRASLAHEESTKTSASSRSASKAAKKEKVNKKRQSTVESIQQPQQDPSYVIYLKEYHLSRATWKFNKTQQIKLINNLFNTYRIPFDLDEALSSYMNGLQGEAARKRIVDSAQRIVDETKGLEGAHDMSGFESAKQMALKAQLKHTKSDLRNREAAEKAYSNEHQEKLRKRKRALLILDSFKTHSSPSPGDGEASARSTEDAGADAHPNVKKKKTRRSRRTRTGIPDDDDTDETSSVSSVPSTTTSSSESEQSGKEESDSAVDSSSSEESSSLGGTSSDDSDSDSD